MLFFYIKKAFDSVIRTDIWNVLNIAGIPFNLIELLVGIEMNQFN